MFDGLSADTLGKINGLMKSSVTTTGISTTTNLLYYNLEPLARRLYPVWFPLLNTIPRKTSDKPGNTVHWKALTAINVGDPGIGEGQRSAYMTFTEQDFLAMYKYLGSESSVTFQAQFGSQGFDDAIGIANENRLFGLMNAEEKITLFGNSGTGTGNNGFQLGTANTPTVSAVTTPSGASTITQSNFAVYVVALTGWGTVVNPITVGSGLGVLTSKTVTSADGSSITNYGGVSQISARSGNVAPSGQSVQVVVSPTAGAVAYAVYISLNASPSTANSYYAGIYPSSTFVINGNGSGSPINYSTSNQTAAATGLNADNSANPLHFDGLYTWAVTGGYTSDFAGAGLTPDGAGGIVEIETVLQYLWDNYKLTVDAIIIGGSKLMTAFTQAVLVGGSGSAVRMNFTTDGAGNLTGGNMVREYRSKFTGGPAKTISVELHPWAPAGTIYFDLRSNPYPESNVSNPREFDVMADHFTIAWPLQTLSWSVGTYTFEVLKHYVAFGTALLTSVGSTLNAVAAS